MNKSGFVIAVILTIVIGVGAFILTGSSAQPPKVEQKARELQQGLEKLSGPAEHTKLDRSKSLRGQTRLFELAGRRYEIPMMYIDGAPKPGEHQDSMLLEVIWPDMGSTNALPTRADYERIRSERRIGWILVESDTRWKPIAEQIASRKQLLTRVDALGKHDGLDAYLWYHGTKESPEAWYQIFIEKDAEGREISFIDCDPPERAKFPNCGDRFSNNGLRYKITYNKAAFFADWRLQRQRAIDFMRSLELNISSTP
jgi:hypothetical protein